MKTWADFYEYVSPSVPGATTDLLDLHIRNAAIEFCADTRVLEEKFEITTSVDEPYYDINLVSGVTPIILNSVFYNGRPLKPDSVDRLDRAVVGWKEAMGAPLAYIFDEPYSIRLYPIPDEAVTLEVSAAVKPSRTATGIDDFVFDRYVEVIANGAISKITAIPQKPYTNPTLQQFTGVSFLNGKQSAKAEVYKSFTRGSLKVRLRKKF